MDSPEQWRWIWLGATAVFAIGEMATPGSFFLAPFAVGALVAALLAFAGVSVTVEWLVFVIVSVIVFALLRPLARRLDRDALDHGVGSRRLIGRQATVLQDIPPGDEIGMVRVDREPWRAQSIDGAPIAAGASVRIADVQGTRVMVTPVDPAVSTPPPALTDPTTTPPPTTPADTTGPPRPAAPPESSAPSGTPAPPAAGVGPPPGAVPDTATTPDATEVTESADPPSAAASDDAPAPDRAPGDLGPDPEPTTGNGPSPHPEPAAGDSGEPRP